MSEDGIICAARLPLFVTKMEYDQTVVICGEHCLVDLDAIGN